MRLLQQHHVNFNNDFPYIINLTDDYQSVIDKIPQKALAENAINIVKPAKLEDTAEIKFNPNDKD